MKENSLENVGRRGTPSWGFKDLRSMMLTNLLDDLKEVETAGLSNEQCNEIKRALSHMVNWATAIPDGSFFNKAIWKVINQFENEYISWNDSSRKGEDAIEHRKKKYQRLRHLRHKIAKKSRKHAHVLNQELDLDLIDDVYKAFGDAVKAAPEVLKNLSSAVKNYFEKHP